MLEDIIRVILSPFSGFYTEQDREKELPLPVRHSSFSNSNIPANNSIAQMFGPRKQQLNMNITKKENDANETATD